MCGFVSLLLPQSCGDNISFNAGFQGIKGDAAQHLQRKTRDENHWFLFSPAVSQARTNHPVFCTEASQLSSYLRLSPLEHCGAMQWLEEVNLAGNVPQISQLSPIAPTRQENEIPLACRVQMQTTGDYDPTPSTWIHLLYSFSTKLRKMSLLTVLKDSMTSKGSAWGNLSARRNRIHTFSWQSHNIDHKKSNQILIIRTRLQKSCSTFYSLLSFQSHFVDGFISWNLWYKLKKNITVIITK